MKKHKKIIYPSFEHYLAQEMKNKTFRDGYKKESQKLEIAYQILQLRKQKRITQTELAKKIGTKQSNIARIEAGRQNLSINTLQKFAQVFNCKVRLVNN